MVKPALLRQKKYEARQKAKDRDIVEKEKRAKAEAKNGIENKQRKV